jgi:hypothetical protein
VIHEADVELGGAMQTHTCMHARLFDTALPWSSEGYPSRLGRILYAGGDHGMRRRISSCCVVQALSDHCAVQRLCTAQLSASWLASYSMSHAMYLWQSSGDPAERMNQESKPRPGSRALKESYEDAPQQTQADIHPVTSRRHCL